MYNNNVIAKQLKNFLFQCLAASPWHHFTILFLKTDTPPDCLISTDKTFHNFVSKYLKDLKPNLKVLNFCWISRRNWQSLDCTVNKSFRYVGFDPSVIRWPFDWFILGWSYLIKYAHKILPFLPILTYFSKLETSHFSELSVQVTLCHPDDLLSNGSVNSPIWYQKSLSAVLALCEGNPLVMLLFDFFFG